MDTGAPLLARGLRAPDFVLPRADGTPTRFYATAGGRPAVIWLFDAGDTKQVKAVEALATALRQDDGFDVSLHAVAHPGADTGSWRQLRDAVPGGGPELLSDADGKVHAAYRAGSGVTGYVLDPNLRVLDGWTDSAAGEAAEAVRAAIAGLAPQEASQITAQAPVLLIPDALGAGMCAELMGVWEQQGSVETGVESSAGGRRADAIAVDYKRRRDHTVTDQALSQRIASEVGRRIMPEIAKAFAFRASRFEGFKIGCYDATTGGFFRAHRDNLSPSTAHRRFALTLNLNDGYSGGHLRFPEYGPQRYRPAGGAALIFSCSLLHEVLDVTDGRRFVLLSFLSGGD